MSKTVVLTGSHWRFHRDGWLNAIVKSLTGESGFYKIAIPRELLADPAVMAFAARQITFARELGGAEHLVVVCESDQNMSGVVQCLRAYDDLSSMREVHLHRADFSTLELNYGTHATWAERCMDPRNNAHGTPCFAHMVMREFRLPVLPHVLSYAGGGADHCHDPASSDPVVRIGIEHIMDSLHSAGLIGRLITTGHTGCRKLFTEPTGEDAQIGVLHRQLRTRGQQMGNRYPSVQVEMHIGHTGATHLTHFTPVLPLMESPLLPPALI